MKRFASHYLFVPESGFLKQYVVELEEERVVRFFPLTEEIESVEWMPGVIVLSKEKAEDLFSAFILYPFDFTTMQPVAETQRKQLR
ncbi:hypothetical protein [Bacteroides sp.]|uniref:hypothetical protein n=1 Tax=Bacteroides sp. TaxID=29523 RepID=UPI001B563C25|nr:hypothetical protein [Bacteroides sp.]MBP6065128.1 hypothetical protein [Bacteroides sp.]MBP6066892.1 hypothetical protein [Bacteroides sp.]MBP6936178.1 hypothetical protein [Bacteroides sp.]MBP9506579.1 hypothetical protein [Bacteroides sp.]MBP9586304.1 hypothetical protein [Bacteroides sp.]